MRAEPLTAALIKWAIARPKLALVLALLTIGAAAVCLPLLEKDTRADAFLAADNPVLTYKAKIKDKFGLSDPIVVAVFDRGDAGVYRAKTLHLLVTLTEQISALANVNASKVTSLATEKNIYSQDDGITIEPFLESIPADAEQLQRLRQAVADFPLIEGTLVAADGSMALIVAEMIDEAQAETTYSAVRALLADTPVEAGVELHVAGEGAIAGYLGEYIDSDARRLNPLAGLIITLTVLFAFYRLTPALACNVVIAAALAVTLGVMAATGVAFYVITNALPVILIGIAVADSIHIYSEYFTLQARSPERPIPELVRATMDNMMRPVTVTTVTTLCGFLGIYAAAFMPPFKYFGLFAALGVFIAWVYSMVFLPAALVLSQTPASARFANNATGQHLDALGKSLRWLGNLILRYPRVILTLWIAISICGIYAASQIVIDEDRIDLFHPDEAVYQADKLINGHMEGTNILDIVVETDRAEGLLDPAKLESMDALQTYVRGLPNVGGANSIVDYLKQMNRALLTGSPGDYRLPESSDSVAQYFLIYSAMADPTDLEEEVDYDYQTAIIRVTLRSASYLDIKPVVEGLQRYLDQQFNSEDIKGTLSGRVSLNYHWFKDLGLSHFLGLAAALLLVWTASALLLRSAVAGTLALIPVLSSVLFVYASMVLLGMTLGIGTSMFAAVAIGLGVDFAIHTLERMRAYYSQYADATAPGDPAAGDPAPDATAADATAQVFARFYQTTARALMINFLAIASGFGVLISSNIVSLNSFGSIVVLAITTSFISSLTLLPAIVLLFRPRVIVAPGPRSVAAGAQQPR